MITAVEEGMMGDNTRKVEASVFNVLVAPSDQFYQSDQDRLVFGWDGLRNFMVLSSQVVGGSFSEADSIFFRITGVVADDQERTYDLTVPLACSYWAWESPKQTQYLPVSGELKLLLSELDNKLTASFEFRAEKDGNVVVISKGVIEASGLDNVGTVENAINKWVKLKA